MNSSQTVELLYRIFLIAEFLLWFVLLLNATTVGIKVYKLRKPLLKNNARLRKTKKNQNQNINASLDDSSNSEKSRRRNEDFSTQFDNLGPELFNWTAMSFTALFRSVYFLALVIIPYRTSYSINCIEIGYCPEEANNSNLVSINFWINFFNDLFYPFFLMVSGGIIILWFKMLWRVQKIKYQECAIRMIIFFLGIILLFFTLAIILDLLYKADMTNSSDSSQTSAIGAELIVFAIGFLIQTLGFAIFGLKFWNQFYHHKRQQPKFTQTYTQILNKVIICIGGLFSVGILLLIIPLPALSGKSHDSTTYTVMQILYSVVLKIIELALATHLQYLLYVSLIEKTDSKIFLIRGRHLWTSIGGSSFSNFVINNENQDNRTSIHAHVHQYEPLDDDDDLEDPDYLLGNEEDDTSLFNEGEKEESFLSFHNTSMTNGEGGNGITYPVYEDYSYSGSRKNTEDSNSGSIVHILPVTDS